MNYIQALKSSKHSHTKTNFLNHSLVINLYLYSHLSYCNEYFDEKIDLSLNEKIYTCSLWFYKLKRACPFSLMQEEYSS